MQHQWLHWAASILSLNIPNPVTANYLGFTNKIVTTSMYYTRIVFWAKAAYALLKTTLGLIVFALAFDRGKELTCLNTDYFCMCYHNLTYSVHTAYCDAWLNETNYGETVGLYSASAYGL